VLDQRRAGTPSAITDRNLAAAAVAASRRRGYLDGKLLAEVFAWLRPDDLVWSNWVHNYLLGRTPPAFDVLFWNADTTRMTAGLHRDFVDLAMHNRLATEDGITVLGETVRLADVTVDAYVIAGVADHITPWQSCYRTTGLLGGDVRFVLSTSGHIAAMVNPPGNPKATFRAGTPDAAGAEAWLSATPATQGSWWPDFTAWLEARSGAHRKASRRLGGGGLRPLVEAPGTYVFDR